MIKFKKKAFKFNIDCFISITFTPTKATVQAAEISQPNIVGKYAVTLDYDTGEIIYAKGIDEKSISC